jgi:hypothetical protein
MKPLLLNPDQVKKHLGFAKTATTIGECIVYIQDKAMEGLIIELTLLEDKQERTERFKEVFISKIAKV